MSTFATQARLVLCQQAMADKGNEIAAIPPLLDMLELPGAVVSIDATGCQGTIARKIVDKKADCVLALKDNHRRLFEDAKLSIRRRKMHAGFNDEYRYQVIFGSKPT